MHRVLSAVVAGTVLVAVSADAEAQGLFGAGVSAGPSIQLSHGKSHNTGYNAAVHITINLPAVPLRFRLEGFYNNFGAKVEDFVENSDLRIAGGNVNVVYNFGSMGARPYVIGGAGFYNSKYAGLSLNDFGFNAGLGAKFRFAGFSTFAEARLHTVRADEPFRFVPISFGIEF
jgi:hypothetical protein